MSEKEVLIIYGQLDCDFSFASIYKATVEKAEHMGYLVTPERISNLKQEFYIHGCYKPFESFVPLTPPQTNRYYDQFNFTAPVVLTAFEEFPRLPNYNLEDEQLETIRYEAASRWNDYLVKLLSKLKPACGGPTLTEFISEIEKLNSAGYKVAI